MSRGRIIFLNGLTSSGKSTAAGLMRDLADEILYVVSNDLFHNMTAGKFWAKDYWGMVAYTIGTQYYAARAMADSGCTVVIDGMLLDLDEYVRYFGKRNFELVQSVFEGCDFTLVDLICPLDELRRRNLVRGNRREFQSEEQSRMMTKEIPASLTIDGMTSLPDETAVRILDFCGLSHSSPPRETGEMLHGKTIRELLSPLGAEAVGVPGDPMEFTVSGCRNPSVMEEAAKILRSHGWIGTDNLLYRESAGRVTERIRIL